MCLTCVDSTKRAFQFKRKYEKSYQHFSRLLNLNNNCEEPECDVQSNSQSECQDDQEGKENERDNANGVTEEDIMERLKFEEDEEEEENEMEVSMMEPWQLCHVSIRNESTIMETDTNGIADSNAGTIDKDNFDKTVFKHFCDTCRKGFPNNTKLIQHSIDHYNLDHNQCPYCSKTYKSRHSLRQHVILHSGERPYECPYCQKAFFYKESRKSHMRVHTGDQSAKSAVEKMASTSSLPPECNFKCSAVDIFALREQTETEELCLAAILNECVDCNVRPDDSLPKQICLSCVLDAQNAFQFKRRCEQSHQHFCELLRMKQSFCEDWQDLKKLCKMEVGEIEDVMKTEEYVVEDSYPEREAGNQLPPKEYSSKSSVNIDYAALELTANETQHQCDTCEEVFPSKTNLMVHALVHTNNDDNSDKCPHCGKIFTTRGSLTRHIRVHSGERPYKCVYCEKSFTQSCNLDKHVRIHSGERPYKCSHCQKAFTQSSHLVNHMRIHSYKCSHCPQNFSDESLLQEHVCAHLTKLAQRQEKYFRRTDLCQSLDRLYKCSICPKRFPSRGDLERHSRVHSGERPFKCSFCSKSFSQSDNLDRHMRVHSGERPYKCLYCLKDFIQSTHLVNHLRIHSGERPFECTRCPKTFTRRENLKKHNHSHSPSINNLNN
ncbi:hypothetical protein ACLKA6_012082 [Drosophila palustris]